MFLVVPHADFVGTTERDAGSPERMAKAIRIKVSFKFFQTIPKSNKYWLIRQSFVLYAWDWVKSHELKKKYKKEVFFVCHEATDNHGFFWLYKFGISLINSLIVDNIMGLYCSEKRSHLPHCVSALCLFRNADIKPTMVRLPPLRCNDQVR